MHTRETVKGKCAVLAVLYTDTFEWVKVMLYIYIRCIEGPEARRDMEIIGDVAVCVHGCPYHRC